MSQRDEDVSLTKELRVSLCESDHAFLNVVALGEQREMQSIVRDLIREYLSAKRHATKVIANYLASEGVVSASRRNAGRVKP